MIFLSAYIEINKSDFARPFVLIFKVFGAFAIEFLDFQFNNFRYPGIFEIVVTLIFSGTE